MAETKKVILDAGHGGSVDPGAVYQGRQEKNDNLRLALAVGQILTENGVDVGYTRVQDVYQSPLQKAQMANNWDADYFVSFHRNGHAGSGNGFRHGEPYFFPGWRSGAPWLPI